MTRLKELSEEEVINKIYHLRGKKVMLDRDLAGLYGVETKVLNQAVKRNPRRFPPDFMFQLTDEELSNWKSQFVTSNFGSVNMGLRKKPFAFTEQGVAMLSSVLNSPTAIDVNIRIIRIFSKIRQMILDQKEILLKIEEMEMRIWKQDTLQVKQSNDITVIFATLKELLSPELQPRKKIGYKRKEEG